MVAPRTVVVGAGPSGLATAFLLHEQGANVTLVERSPDPTIADPNRSFSYLVSSRGQRTMCRLGLMDSLKNAGTSAVSNTFNVYDKSGDVKRIIIAPGISEQIKKTTSPGYWLARSSLVRIMLNRVREQGGVNVILGAAVKDISFNTTGDVATVHIEHTDAARTETLQAELVVGCDGMRSAVRRALALANDAKDVSSTRGFEIDQWQSPAVGLPYKILVLGAQPQLPAFDEDAPASTGAGCEHLQRAKPNESYVFRGALSGREAMRMGLLPVGSGTKVARSGNVILPANRALWSARNADEAYKLFERNFPYLNVRQLIAEAEMERFVAAPLSKFPPIQRSRSLVASARGAAGAALLGDAAHAFPPDIGQGVNAALEDALMFCDALATASDVRTALGAYEAARDEDISALMRLMQLGNPYQYRQSAVGYNLVRANTLMRFVLNKLAPSIFSPQAFVAIIEDMPYSEVLRRVNKTTMRIYAVFAALLAVGIGVYITIVR